MTGLHDDGRPDTATPLTSSDDADAPLVSVEGLRVALPTGEEDTVEAVSSVDLVVRRGERVGIVGESGSGKSVTGRSIAGLLPSSPRVQVRGSIRIGGKEMVGALRVDWDAVRRKTVGMIFQDPLTFLNPTMRVGRQVAEAVDVQGGDRAALKDTVGELLSRAGFEHVEEVVRRFPHELSGGMRQRVLIAIAIAKSPDLIIADEPTTALDATVQQRVLSTLDTAVNDLGTSLVLISHDLAVVAHMTDRIYVMYAGRMVESGRTREVLSRPKHPYTRALLRSVRSLTDSGVPLYSMPPSLRQELAREVSRAP